MKTIIMKIEIEFTEQELKDLKRVRNYFGEHNKTTFEHAAYAIVDNVVKKLQQPLVMRSNCPHPIKKRTYIGSNMLRCGVCGAEFE